MNTRLGENTRLNNSPTSNRVDELLDMYGVNSKVHGILNKNDKLKINVNGSLNYLNQDEFERLILQIIAENPHARTIDLSEIIQNQKLHFYLYNIIGNNFPLVGISRLIEGQKAVDITFLGIKTLNDNIGKDFVDLFIGKLKEIIKRNFRKIVDEEKPGRIIRDNYKHLTFSIRNDLDLSEKLFGGQKEKENLIKQVLNNISNSDINKALQFSGKQNLNKSDIESLISENFDFGIGGTLVKGDSSMDKLISFYKGEISSRNIAELDNLGEDINYDFENIQHYSREIINIENILLRDFSKKTFIHDGTNYDIIINGRINPLLIRYTRKGEKIGNKELENLIESYIENLNNGFDFISPVAFKDDFENLEKINSQIGSGKINVKYLQTNYKKTYSKEALKIHSRYKKGLRVFIDIVDMGIMNLINFRKLAGKVHSGEINENNFDELLKAGDSVTKRFLFLVQSIKDLYPESKVSLGGDEVFLFIPGKNNSETDEIIENISKKISRFGLKARISSEHKEHDHFSKIFDSLDGLTSINKIFEKAFTKTIHNKPSLSLLGVSEPIVTNLEIENTYIIKNNSKIILNKISEYIYKVDFESLLSKREQINIPINFSTVTEGITKNYSLSLNLTKKNNFITIKIS